MRQSSESVASLATALAKAQIELINPEKSLIANLRTEMRGEPNQSFRYAPLSRGLDIIRKTLGRHEIAVMQTTAFDTASGLVNLTTLLAHTSGDWISSDWPVCPISDIAKGARAIIKSGIKPGHGVDNNARAHRDHVVHRLGKLGLGTYLGQA